jgi:pectate lyase
LVLTMGAKLVWIDHNNFSDGARPDYSAEQVYGQKVQHHDGAIDIVRQASYITVSYNHIRDHDKTMLFGNSDGRKEDAGNIKVTVHHNFFENSGQRNPRVRYGEVHAYNNYHVGSPDSQTYPYVYALGVGIDSRLYSQNNAFDIAGITADKIIEIYKGTRFFDSGSLLNGAPVDIVAASNAARPKTQLDSDVGWTPILVEGLQPADAVAATVKANAGVGKIMP